MIDPILANLLASIKRVKTIRELNFFFETLFSPRELAQTPKRLECLRRIASGEDYKKIAGKIGASTGTIAKASNIYKALEKENPRWWLEYKKLHGIEDNPKYSDKKPPSWEILR